MIFNLKTRTDELKNKYTEKSIKEFLQKEWIKCRYPNEQNWEMFVANSVFLEEVAYNEEDIIYFANDLPMPNWMIYVIPHYLKQLHNITFTTEEEDYFNCACAYLYHYKQVPIQNIYEAIKKIIPLGQQGFFKKFASAKSLNTVQAKIQIQKILDEFHNDECKQ